MCSAEEGMESVPGLNDQEGVKETEGERRRGGVRGGGVSVCVHSGPGCVSELVTEVLVSSSVCVVCSLCAVSVYVVSSRVVA